MNKNIKKTITYIDGFNLYHGLCASGLRKFLWLDVNKLSRSLLPSSDYKLTKTKYFTSRVKGFPNDPGKPVRQAKYIDSIGSLTRPKVFIEEGRYQAFPSHCKHCNNDVYCPTCKVIHVKPNEKKTDVNIATFILVDALEKKCDVQILISGDSDYENLLLQHRRVFPSIELIVAFPPSRKNNQLIGNNKCTQSFVIKENNVATSQMPDPVVFSKWGRTISISKPAEWN